MLTAGPVLNLVSQLVAHALPAVLSRAQNLRCTVITDLAPQNGAHRKPFPAVTPSWNLAPRPRSKHVKPTAGSTRATWTVAAADGVRCARVR
jgi:hypothetical protein